ncbi:MAG: hypothetical protein ACR2NN_29810 [Bryobacteraceae bacterium]
MLEEVETTVVLDQPLRDLHGKAVSTRSNGAKPIAGYPLLANHQGFFARFFFALSCFHFCSALSTSVLEIVNIFRTALSNRSASVFPGTLGAGAGFNAFSLKGSFWNFFHW